MEDDDGRADRQAARWRKLVQRDMPCFGDVFAGVLIGRADVDELGALRHQFLRGFG